MLYRQQSLPLTAYLSTINVNKVSIRQAIDIPHPM